MSDMFNTINKQFEGHKQGPQDCLFEKYASTWCRVSFRRHYEDTVKTPYYQECLERVSYQLANNNMIEFKDGDKTKRRHLSRDEYDRVNSLRLSAGTGQLLPYDQVKAKDNVFGISDAKFEFAYSEEEAKKILDSTEVEF